MKYILYLIGSLCLLSACGDRSSKDKNTKNPAGSAQKITVICSCGGIALAGKGDDESKAKEQAKKRCDKKKGTLSGCEKADLQK